MQQKPIPTFDFMDDPTTILPYKKTNRGTEYLVPKNEWVPENEIQGNDEILFHPMMKKAYEKIVACFKPKHQMALISLCTSTRPYSKSRKWSTFSKLYARNADLIICSDGGGIIPIEYESCYPYLTYDAAAHGPKKYNEIHIKVITERLLQFFNAHHYDVLVFNFRPGMRDRKAAKNFKREYKGDSEIHILPTTTVFKKVVESGFPSGKMFPDLDPRVLEEISQVINSSKKSTSNSYNIFEE